MMQQMQQVPPSAENEKYYETMSRIPMMSDDELSTYVNSGFGAIALAEISRRNRLAMQKQAANAAMQGGGTIADAEIQKMMQAKMADRMAADDRMGLNNIVAQAEQGGLEFGQPTQSMAGGGIVAFSDGVFPVRSPLSDDERLIIMNKAREMKLNNPERILQEIESSPENVAKYRKALSQSPSVRSDRSRFAEDTGIEPSALPGFLGNLFDYGLKDNIVTQTLGSLSRKNPIERKQEEMEKQLRELELEESAFAARGLELDPESKIALKGLRTTLGKDTGPQKTIDTSRFFPKEEVEKERARAAGADKKDGAGTGVGKAGIEPLFNTDAAKILEERKKLLEAQGIGEFGADIERMLGESEAKTKKGLEGLKLVKAATSGAKAVGGRGRERKTGIEALAAAVSGAAEGAGGVAERELDAQTKFDEFRMKQAMAKDAYARGEVGKADELARDAQKAKRDYDLKTRELDILDKYRTLQGQAAIAKAGQQYGVKPGDVVNAMKQSDLLRQRLAMLDPEDEANAAEIQQINRDLEMLKALAAAGTLKGMGLQIQDVPDEE